MKGRIVGVLTVCALAAGGCGDEDTSRSRNGGSGSGSGSGNGSGSGGGSASGTSPQLEVKSMSATDLLEGLEPNRDLFLIIEVALTLPAGAANSLPVTVAQFSLGLSDNTSVLPTALPVPDQCPSDRLLDPGGSIDCSIGFDLERDAGLVELRFLDPSRPTEAPVTAALPSDRIPVPDISDNAQLSALNSSQREQACSTMPGLSGPTTCEIMGFPFQVTPEPVSGACPELLMPLTVRGFDGCARIEASGCTVGEYRACASLAADDACLLASAIATGLIPEPCLCTTPLFSPCD